MSWQMIVEPSSLHARSPLRRLLRAAGFTAPVALFAAILAAGLLGPKPAQEVAIDASPSALAAASPSASPTPTAPTIEPAAAFPASFMSMAALRPSDALRLRASPDGPPAVLAVAGYLAVTGAPIRCDVPGITSGAWCDRPAVLFESANAGGLDATGSRPPHLHVTVPAGVVLPSPVTAGGTAAAGSVPVLVVGRFALAGTCAGDVEACDQGFVLERVVWAADTMDWTQPLSEPGAATPLTVPLSPPGTGSLLLAVLARPGTVARLDPDAGAAAEGLASHPALVWYVRELAGASGSPTVGWSIVDPDSGARLASGPSPLPPVAAAPPPASAPQG